MAEMVCLGGMLKECTQMLKVHWDGKYCKVLDCEGDSGKHGGKQKSWIEKINNGLA